MWLGLLAGVCAAQTARPHFELRQRLLEPGAIIEMYGTNLAPAPFCTEPIPAGGPYPTQVCGVRVTAAGFATGLLYVSARQINLKLPDGLPDGPAPLQVCVRDLCSDPVMKQFSTHTALIRVQEPVYAGMPIWVDVDMPPPNWLSYPCLTDPWDFRGNAMEVLHEGSPVVRAPKPHASDLQSSGPSPCLFGGSQSRFPLHLAYRLEPGVYSIRFSLYRDGEVALQSAWLDIEVKACPPAVRSEWLQSMTGKIKVASLRDLAGDIIPSLMASPDDQTLRVLMPLYSAQFLSGRGCSNLDCLFHWYIQNSLAAFDEATLRRNDPSGELVRRRPPQVH